MFAWVLATIAKFISCWILYAQNFMFKYKWEKNIAKRAVFIKHDLLLMSLQVFKSYIITIMFLIYSMLSSYLRKVTLPSWDPKDINLLLVLNFSRKWSFEHSFNILFSFTLKKGKKLNIRFTYLRKCLSTSLFLLRLLNELYLNIESLFQLFSSLSTIFLIAITADNYISKLENSTLYNIITTKANISAFCCFESCGKVCWKFWRI